MLLCLRPARVRRDASLESPVLGELEAGAIVDVVARGAAGRVLVRRGARVSGWVSAAKCFLDTDASFASEGGMALVEFGRPVFLAWRAAYACGAASAPSAPRRDATPPRGAAEEARPRAASAAAMHVPFPVSSPALHWPVQPACPACPIPGQPALAATTV